MITEHKEPLGTKLFRLMPKELARASEDGIAIIVRPQDSGSYGVFAVDVTTPGGAQPLEVNWYEVDEKNEIPRAITSLNRDLDKFYGRGGRMSERGRFRDKLARAHEDYQYFIDVLESLVQDVSEFDEDGNPIASEDTVRRLRELGNAMFQKSLRLEARAQVLEGASRKLRRVSDRQLLDTAIGVIHSLKSKTASDDEARAAVRLAMK